MQTATKIWPWVAGLYIVKPRLKVNAAEDETDNAANSTTELSHMFVCSAVFIHDNWLVVPAHCILNSSMYERYVQRYFDDLQDESNEVNDDVGKNFMINFFIRNLNCATCLQSKLVFAELDEFIVEEETESEEQLKVDSAGFSYVIISSQISSITELQFTWPVVKWIVHPKYSSERKNSMTSSNSTQADVDDELKAIKLLQSLSQFDIALLKIEKDDAILQNKTGPSKVVPPESTFNSFSYSLTGSANAWKPINFACVETLKGGLNGKESFSTNSLETFRFPSELSRIERNTFDESLPKKAACIIAGYSPNGEG